MGKPKRVLIHPAPDKDRLISRRRTKSSVAQLNLPILAAHADDRFDVCILDENVEEIEFGAVSADLAGISLMTSTALRGYEIADDFRKRGIPVVLGGMHVFFMPDEALTHADALVVGEGEYAWNDLLDDFLAGRLKKSYRAERLHDLKGLPRPRSRIRAVRRRHPRGGDQDSGFLWSRYDANHVVIRPAGMSKKELTEGYIRTYRDFYSMRSIFRRALATRRDKVHTVVMNLGRKLNARYFEEGCRL